MPSVEEVEVRLAVEAAGGLLVGHAGGDDLGDEHATEAVAGDDLLVGAFLESSASVVEGNDTHSELLGEVVLDEVGGAGQGAVVEEESEDFPELHLPFASADTRVRHREGGGEVHGLVHVREERHLLENVLHLLCEGVGHSAGLLPLLRVSSRSCLRRSRRCRRALALGNVDVLEPRGARLRGRRGGVRGSRGRGAGMQLAQALVGSHEVEQLQRSARRQPGEEEADRRDGSEANGQHEAGEAGEIEGEHCLVRASAEHCEDHVVVERRGSSLEGR
mmetsp:Transcript_4659/g.16396  ORF Transcript_4659/g.16396 Transcript_4659/m.16396 type:complete len:276 (-) Transcript_4659:400-1227(-)